MMAEQCKVELILKAHRKRRIITFTSLKTPNASMKKQAEHLRNVALTITSRRQLPPLMLQIATLSTFKKVSSHLMSSYTHVKKRLQVWCEIFRLRNAQKSVQMGGLDWIKMPTSSTFFFFF